MKRFLFFAYRDWAINIFKEISSLEDEYILITNKKLCTIDFINIINPDVIFFYGWSWMVSQKIVDSYICLCLHPSKLPKYRGGTPIQNQIIAGEKFSAVTIFKMEKGLDDGDIYYQVDFELNGYLDIILKKIENFGIIGTKDFIENYKNDSILWIKQNKEEATTYKRLKPNNSEIKPEDFLNNDAEYFYNKVRSLQKPYPECYINCKTGKIILKIIEYEKDI